MSVYHQKDIEGLLGVLGLVSIAVNILALIMCRKGCQKHLDPTYKNMGALRLFSGSGSVALMIRTAIYGGASFTERGRKKYFEGRDPRTKMPSSLRFWIRTYWFSGAILLLLLVVNAVFNLLKTTSFMMHLFPI